MLYGRIVEESLRVEHQHNDGSWATLEQAPHDVADHDPERDWANGRIYKCMVCDELVRVSARVERPGTGDDPARGG